MFACTDTHNIRTHFYFDNDIRQRKDVDSFCHQSSSFIAYSQYCVDLSLVLVQPRKTRPFIYGRLLIGRKESNKKNKQTILCYEEGGHVTFE